MFQEAPINYGNVVSGSVTPPPALNGTYFYIRVTGYLIPSVTGLHTIGVNCQDGCNLFIGDAPLVANLAGGDTAASSLGYTRSSTIMLTAGVYYPITIEMQHGGGSNYQLQLIWTPPKGSMALIPAANLSNTQNSVTEVLNVSFWNGTAGLWYPGGNGTIDFANPAHPNKTLDNIPDGTTRSLGPSAAAVAADIAVETTRAEAAEATLASDISTETARAEAAEATLTSGLAAIVPMTSTSGGLVPMPPNLATKYLDGTGNFSTPAGGGGGGGGGGNVTSQGTNAGFKSSPPSSPSAGDRYICTDSPYEYVYTGSAWQAYIFGFAVVEPILGAFTQVNASAFTLDDTHGGIEMLFPAGTQTNATLGILAAAPGSGAYYVDCAFACFLNFDNGGVGPGLANGDTSGSSFVCGKYGFESAVGAMWERQAYSDFNTWNNNQGESNAGPNSHSAATGIGANTLLVTAPLVWFRIYDDGSSNRTWYISINGYQWVQIYQEPRTEFITPSYAGFFGGNYSSNYDAHCHLVHFSVHT